MHKTRYSGSGRNGFSFFLNYSKERVFVGVKAAKTENGIMMRGTNTAVKEPTSKKFLRF